MNDEHYLELNNILIESRNYNVTDEQLQLVIQGLMLDLPFSNNDIKKRIIFNLTSDPLYREKLMSLNIFEYLIPLCIEGDIAATASVANLLYENENRIIAQENYDLISIFIKLLEEETDTVLLTHAARGLYSLSVIYDYKKLIMDKGFEHLIRLLNLEVENLTINCIGTLANLAIYNDNKNIMVEKGILPILHRIGEETTNDEIKFEITRCLYSLAASPENRIIIINNGFLPLLIRFISSENINVQSNAIGTIGNLSLSKNLVLPIVNSGILIRLIPLLNSNSNNARILGEIVRTIYNLIKNDEVKDIILSYNCIPSLFKILNIEQNNFGDFIRYREFIGRTLEILIIFIKNYLPSQTEFIRHVKMLINLIPIFENENGSIINSILEILLYLSKSKEVCNIIYNNFYKVPKEYTKEDALNYIKIVNNICSFFPEKMIDILIIQNTDFTYERLSEYIKCFSTLTKDTSLENVFLQISNDDEFIDEVSKCVDEISESVDEVSEGIDNISEGVDDFKSSLNTTIEYITLLSNDNQYTVIKKEKLLKFPYFNSLFSNNWKDSDITEVKLNVSRESLDIIVDYMNYGYIKSINDKLTNDPTITFEILLFSGEYIFNALKFFCEKQLIKIIDDYNVFSILKKIEDIQAPFLQLHCIYHILKSKKLLKQIYSQQYFYHELSNLTLENINKLSELWKITFNQRNFSRSRKSKKLKLKKIRQSFKK